MMKSILAFAAVLAAAASAMAAPIVYQTTVGHTNGQIPFGAGFQQIYLDTVSEFSFDLDTGDFALLSHEAHDTAGGVAYSIDPFSVQLQALPSPLGETLWEIPLADITDSAGNTFDGMLGLRSPVQITQDQLFLIDWRIRPDATNGVPVASMPDPVSQPWITNWLMRQTTGGALVPEPATCVLFLLLATMCACLRVR